MIVFGGGFLNVRSGERATRHQLIHRGHRHRRPGRDTNRRWQLPWAGLVVGSYAACSAPHEAGAVGPVAMQDDGNFASDGDLGLLGADPLH